MATILTSPVSPCLGSKLNRLAPPASHTTLNLSYSASSFPAFRSNTTVFHVSPPLHRDLARCFALPGNKEDKLTQEGLITESLPNGMFRVRLDFTQDVILGYASGRIRRGSIRILPGDRVRIEVSRYDSMKGRIIYRLRGASKDSNPP